MFGVARSGISVMFANIKIVMILGVVSAVLYFLFQYGEGRAAMVKADYLRVAAEETQEAANRSMESFLRVQESDTESDVRLAVLHDENVRLQAQADVLRRGMEDINTEDRTDCSLSCLVPWDLFNGEESSE